MDAVRPDRINVCTGGEGGGAVSHPTAAAILVIIPYKSHVTKERLGGRKLVWLSLHGRIISDGIVLGDSGARHVVYNKMMTDHVKAPPGFLLERYDAVGGG